jgi:hypothetical protein
MGACRACQDHERTSLGLVIWGHILTRRLVWFDYYDADNWSPLWFEDFLLLLGYTDMFQFEGVLVVTREGSGWWVKTSHKWFGHQCYEISGGEGKNSSNVHWSSGHTGWCKLGWCGCEPPQQNFPRFLALLRYNILERRKLRHSQNSTKTWEAGLMKNRRVNLQKMTVAVMMIVRIQTLWTVTKVEHGQWQCPFLILP